MRSLLLAACGLLLTAGTTYAQDAQVDFQKADKALNETFQEVEKRLVDDASGKTRLIHAQRAWVAFRDAECAFQSQGPDGGSAAPMVIAACAETLTSARTEQLKAYLDCEEGDLSCPVPGS